MPLTIAVISPNTDVPEVVQPVLTAEDRLIRFPDEDFPFQELREAAPDVIIIDVSHPPLHKIELLNRLERHAATRRAAVIAISDSADLEFEFVRVLDFLIRPIDRNRLCAAIDGVRTGGAPPERQAESSLTHEEHRQFHDFLLLNTGLHFEKRNLRILERGLRHRMGSLKLPSYQDYYNYLLRFHESRNELKKLLQFLTVGETFFFRYHGHFDALAHLVIPHLRREKGNERQLRIWSAGCSTGEEPYSIAMTLREEMPDLCLWNVTINATDINHASLTAAREGIYGERTMRLTPPVCIDRYFTRSGTHYAVGDSVKKMVEFSWLNLQAPFPWQKEEELFDIIFCRNVLIYFSPSTLKNVVAKLSAALRPGGFLFLGHAESLYQISDEFEPVSRSGSFFYRKRVAPREAARPTPQKIDSSERRADLILTPPLPVPEPLPAQVEEPPVCAEAPEPVADVDFLLAEAWAQFAAEDFTEADRQCREVLALAPENTAALVLSGFILANEGKLDEALEKCEAALSANDLMAEAYYLKGLVNDLADRAGDAGSDYRRAILLRTDLVMAHYCLARLLFRQGKHDDGIRSLKSALRELDKTKPLSQIPFSGGLSREEMIELVRKEVGSDARRVSGR